MTGSEFGGSSSQGAVNSDHVRTDRREEIVDHRVGSVLQRPYDDLCVHGGGHHDVIATRQVSAEEFDGPVVLGVGRVEKADDNIGIERYSRHSPRRSSR